MMQRSLALALCLLAASCLQLIDADHPYQEKPAGSTGGMGGAAGNGGMPPVNCTVDGDCNDNNPCTTDTCNAEHMCKVAAIPDGPVATQQAGDCHRTDCVNGALASVVDAMDVLNDLNPCTVDTCVAGEPMSMAEMDGKSCSLGGNPGICKSSICEIACQPGTTMCDDMNPCTNDGCDAMTGKCTTTDLDGMPTPGVANSPTDCKKHMCVAGKDTLVDDNTEVPDDGKECTTDTCMGGIPSFTPKPQNTPCTQGGGTTCDAAGICQKGLGATCTLSAECLSGMCVDGVCCDSICDARCYSCNQATSLGTCKEVPQYSMDLCDPNYVCSIDGYCKKANGQKCTMDVECASYNCAGTNPNKACAP